MKKWLKAIVPALMALFLSGCLFRSPDDLYKPPEAPVGYERLRAAIQRVRGDLEAELGVSTELALIVSGDNTATIQLQDLDGDGARESAVTFLRASGVEKALKIYIFTQKGEEDYQVAGVVEGDGTAIYSVDYVDLNGGGSKELVVNWQISTGAYQLGAYTLDELQQARRPEGESAAGRSDLLATELLLTGCSGASDVSSVSSGYCLVDLDQDTRTEIAVARIDPTGLNSLIELYGWRDGGLASVGTAELSAGIAVLNRIRSNYLRGELSPPALYVSSTLADGSKAIDVLAYQTAAGGERKMKNLSLLSSGVSRDVLQGYTDVALTDINGDSVLELPAPTALPTYGEGASSNFWLIDWNQYSEAGRRRHIMTTYHNVADSWYLEIPEDWRGRITISRNDQVSGRREVVFSLWRGLDEAPQPFLSVYRLTGSNRASAAAGSGRFILREEESVIYAAKFYDCEWDCGMEEADLLNSFKIIQRSWY